MVGMAICSHNLPDTAPESGSFKFLSDTQRHALSVNGRGGAAVLCIDEAHFYGDRYRGATRFLDAVERPALVGLREAKRSDIPASEQLPTSPL